MSQGFLKHEWHIFLRTSFLSPGANQICPTTRGHDFFPGGLKGGAHGGGRFSAASAAVALREVVGPVCILRGKGQLRIEGGRWGLGCYGVAQTGIDSVSFVEINDLPGIQSP